MSRGDSNGRAWEKLFQQYSILDRVQQDGLFEISAEQIKPYREPRLMTKFDDSERLPSIFRDNGLGILPNTRGTYLIGEMNLFHKFEKQPTAPIQQITPAFPLESIDYTQIMSEAMALNSAYSSGMLSCFLGEENLYPTISGRMKSSPFSFKVEGGSQRHHINVHNAQMEIDGGYEGERSITLIEAKMHLANDFLVRQLYYPFRRWEVAMHKRVRSVFLTYTNGIYHFREYEFRDTDCYNSIELLKDERYIIGTDSPQLTLQSIRDIIAELEAHDEDCHPEAIIPQADDFGRVINILEELMRGQDLESADISEQQHFTLRQSDYYMNAAIFLGLIQKEESRYQLTSEGKRIMGKDIHGRNLALAQAMLRPRFLRKAMRSSIEQGVFVTIPEMTSIMRSVGIRLGDSTIERRAQTARSWIKWLLDNCTED